MLTDLFDGFPCDPAVKRDKIYAVLRVKTNHIYKILRRKRRQISLIMDHRIIDRNSPDHGRAFCRELSAERRCIAMRG